MDEKEQSIMKNDSLLPRTITRSWLDQHEACKSQVDLFESVWPNGVVLTRKALTIATTSGLNLGWLAKKILSPTAHADYQVKRDALDIDYLAGRALLDPQYQAMRDVLYADHLTKRAPFDVEYRAKLVTLYDEFNARGGRRRDDYQAKLDTLHAEHKANRDSLHADYRAKTDPQDADYMATRAPLDSEYLAKCNTLLIAALWDVYKKKAKQHEE